MYRMPSPTVDGRRIPFEPIKRVTWSPWFCLKLSQFFRQVRRFDGSIIMDLMGEGATMIEEFSIYVSLTVIDPLEL